MGQTMLVEKLHRLTLVRKGRAVAKHPDMRDGVLEVVKADDAETLDTSTYDWYEDFAAFVRQTADEDIPEDGWEAAYEGYKESAKKNYPDGSGPFAGPHNSFPIRSQHHVYAAARLLGHATNKAAVKANIIRIAHEKGYSLPKSWQKKTKKAEDPELKAEAVDAALAALRQSLLGDQEVAKAEETPPAVESPVVDPAVGDPPVADPEPAAPSDEPVAPEAEEVDKAKATPHAHNHSHITTYGYSYSHEHPHGDSEHADAENHYASETMHAHEHVAKSGDGETDGLLADVAGLKNDLDNEREALSTARSEVETLKAELATLQAAKAEAEVLKSAAEVKAQDLYRNLLRRPLTAPTQSVEKSAPPITTQTPWDEAFAIAMGR